MGIVAHGAMGLRVGDARCEFRIDGCRGSAGAKEVGPIYTAISSTYLHLLEAMHDHNQCPSKIYWLERKVLEQGHIWLLLLYLPAIRLFTPGNSSFTLTSINRQHFWCPPSSAVSSCTRLRSPGTSAYPPAVQVWSRTWSSCCQRASSCHTTSRNTIC